MTNRASALLALILLANCATNTCPIVQATHACQSNTWQIQGIPNLVRVHPYLYRGGQPQELASWQLLYKLGVRHVIKLNCAPGEGSDVQARHLGMTVHDICIEPRVRADPLAALAGAFRRPSSDAMFELEGLLRAIAVDRGRRGGWYIHCKNGHDRTGLAIGMWRVLGDAWTKEQAFVEMDAFGFHRALAGLSWTWHDFTTAP
jgi:protein tyrosine/serine phosphatase